MKNEVNNSGVNKSNINWFPGHMQKTKRLIKEKLDLIDIVYEVIDARIPYSSKIKDIDELIKNKPRILIMTKKDLCDLDKTILWKQYYENQGYHVLIVDLNTNDDYKKIIDLTNEVTKELKSNWESKGLISKDIKALVVGIPNVGKSTLINKLAKRKALNVGDKPGVTKAQSMVRVSDDLILYDTPGVLWPKFEDQEVGIKLAICSSIRDEILDLEYLTLYALDYLVKNYKDLLEKRYEINIESNDPNEILDLICVKKGCLLKGGLPDRLRASKMIINDIRNVRIGAISFEKPE